MLNADNPRDAKVYKFNQVLDRPLLEFVHTKLDLYKKLTESKVNEMLKRQWFDVLAKDIGTSDTASAPWFQKTLQLPGQAWSPKRLLIK